jgi:hypothetical protein
MCVVTHDRNSWNEFHENESLVRKNLFTMTNSQGPQQNHSPDAECDIAERSRNGNSLTMLPSNDDVQSFGRPAPRLARRPQRAGEMVEPIGIEPTTSSLQSSRSPN